MFTASTRWATPDDADHNASATATTNPIPSDELERLTMRVSWSSSRLRASDGRALNRLWIRCWTSVGLATSPYNVTSAANAGTSDTKPKYATPAADSELWSSR